MSQQQLLRAVLSTVIVGLATVAGIQAFSENQAQASQDALVQKGVSIATDIQAVASKPSQLGGIDTTSAGSGDIANAIGLSGAIVDADGAGSNGRCEITVDGNTPLVSCASADANQDIQVTVQPNDITTSTSSSYSVGS